MKKKVENINQTMLVGNLFTLSVIARFLYSKMKQSPQLLLLFTFSLFAFHGFSQDAKTDFSKVNIAYLNAKEYSLDMVTYGYKTLTEKQGEKVAEGNIKRSGDKYYSKFMGNEMIKANGKVLIVSHKTKTIQLHQEKVKQSPLGNFAFPMDSVLAKYDSVVYKGKKGVELHYIVYNQASQYPVVEVFLNSKTFFIDRMILFFPKHHDKIDYGMEKLEVKYTTSVKATSAEWYNINRFVRQLNGKYIPVKEYSNYQLL